MDRFGEGCEMAAILTFPFEEQQFEI
jgi:hypothetical protein